MFAEYLGRSVILTSSALRELDELHLDLDDVIEVLENGLDCSSGGGRKPGIVEKCLAHGRKVIRAVVCEGFFEHPLGNKEEVFYLIHVSQETFKKSRWK